MRLTLPTRKQAGRSVGLDVDDTFLAAVELSQQRVARAASAALPAGIVVDGEVASPEALSDVLRDFAREHRVPRKVWLGVANQQIIVRRLELPRIEDEAELDAAVRFQAAEVISMPLEEASLDYVVVPRRAGDEAAGTRVVLVAARAAMVTRLLDAVRAAGLQPQGVELGAFALVRALAPVPGDERARAHCHLGGVANLAIAVGGTCVITRPLARGQEQPSAAALAEEIRLSIDYYLTIPAAPPIEEIVLSGPGALREGLAEQVGAALHLPATLAPPLGRLAAGGLPEDAPRHRLTMAAGLALGATA